MSRYTITNLRADLESINQSLESIGSEFRLSESGRYGYQAVDIETVEQRREGKGNICRNLEGGTSRECMEASYVFLRNESNRLMREKIDLLENYPDELLLQMLNGRLSEFTGEITDNRYSIAYVFSGNEMPKMHVTFCNEMLGAFFDPREAIEAVKEHTRKRESTIEGAKS